MVKKRHWFPFWKSPKKTYSKDYLSSFFRFKYNSFKMLLESNSELLKILTDLEEKLKGRQVFGMSYVRAQSIKAVFHTLRMAKNLNDLSNNHYPTLFLVLENINGKIKEALGAEQEITVTELTLPYSQITAEMVDWVGGKNANLGEVQSRVRLPIPEGFAITTRAYHLFLEHNDLRAEITRKLSEIDPNNAKSIQGISEDIQRLLLTAVVPLEIEEAILSEYRKTRERIDRDQPAESQPRMAMRSSAIGEDSELSFAGQYRSVLNVPPSKLVETYKLIVASLYTPRAISYRLNKGIRDEEMAMSVACLEMVESVASGIIYSRNPVNLLDNSIMINALWGLGPYAVEGRIIPDTYTVSKNGSLEILVTAISNKPVQLVMNPEGGLIEVPVPREDQETPCLSPGEVTILADYAIRLEEHFQTPQDIEWALDKKGWLLVLQSRPLHLLQAEKHATPTVPLIQGYPLLVDKAAVASPGVGWGPAFQVVSDDDLNQFPEGAVLIAKHSSPKYVIIMKKTQAIVADSGSVTGHMASLAREFGVPTLLGAKGATANIPSGMEITVDAYSGKVYQGKVPELIALQSPRDFHLQETPVYQVLRKVADLIVPLNLLDPKAPNFAPEFCRTLHDVGRLVHEFSYNEMFNLGDFVSDNKGFAFKLKAKIPLDLFVIDLGGGVIEAADKSHKVTVDRISSIPFKALLRGMTHEAFQIPQVRPIQLKGFFSVMSEQMLRPPQATERFGDRSYAIISDKYLNFSSRVGYHYSILDCYCGQTINKNYITFSFKGGAADDLRRNRRVRAIALVLEALDFVVDVKGDRVNARFQKYDCPLIEEKLDQVGRLLLYTRQMDMLMNNEESVEAVAKHFLEGNYHYE